MRRERVIAIGALILLVLFTIRLIPFERGVKPVMAPLDPPFFAVYYASQSDVLLVPELVPGNGTIQERIDYLQNGPSWPGHVSVLPKETRVLDYSLHGSLLYLNFSEHLITNHPGGSSGELITVYGIVNTFTNIPAINSVQILVEGATVETLAGHIYISEPLHADYALTGCSLI